MTDECINVLKRSFPIIPDQCIRCREQCRRLEFAKLNRKHSNFKNLYKMQELRDQTNSS